LISNMFFDCRANSTHKRVLDIGAMDVNEVSRIDCARA
jgi:hypothetical protein